MLAQAWRWRCAWIAAWGLWSSLASGQPPHTPDPVLGRRLFERVWESEPSVGQSADRLGPMYNDRSCVACHFSGGIGGAGNNEHNVDLLSVDLSTPVPREKLEEFRDRVVCLHPGFRDGANVVLHAFSSDRRYALFRERLLGLEPPANLDPARQAMALKEIRRRQGTGPIKRIEHGDVTLLLSERNTTPLFGVGLINRVTPGELAGVAAAQTKTNPNVTGRFVGRFGWRGQVADLQGFVRGACAVELGLQSTRHQQAANPLDLRRNQLPDLSEGECDDLVAFVASLPRPGRRRPAHAAEAALIKNGENLFGTIGCAVCHLPDLGAIEGLYSDLLVHDMGARLEDPSPITRTATASYYGGIQLFAVPPLAEDMREWKTPPLWGLRDSAPYLHDGRAATVEEAIAWHGGEAGNSVDRFFALPAADRGRILLFLSTLVAPDEKLLAPPRDARPVAAAPAGRGVF